MRFFDIYFDNQIVVWIGRMCERVFYFNDGGLEQSIGKNGFSFICRNGGWYFCAVYFVVVVEDDDDVDVTYQIQGRWTIFLMVTRLRRWGLLPVAMLLSTVIIIWK